MPIYMVTLQDPCVGSILLTCLCRIAHRTVEVVVHKRGEQCWPERAITIELTFELHQGNKSNGSVACTANRDGARLEIFSHISGVMMKPAKRAMRVVFVTSVMNPSLALAPTDLMSSSLFSRGISGGKSGGS